MVKSEVLHSCIKKTAVIHYSQNSKIKMNQQIYSKCSWKSSNILYNFYL